MPMQWWPFSSSSSTLMHSLPPTHLMTRPKPILRSAPIISSSGGPTWYCFLAIKFSSPGAALHFPDECPDAAPQQVIELRIEVRAAPEESEHPILGIPVAFKVHLEHGAEVPRPQEEPNELPQGERLPR